MNIEYCPCGCHNKGMIEHGLCCRAFKHKEYKEPDIVLDKCLVCKGSGFLIKEVYAVGRIVPAKMECICKDCNGKGYAERK